MTLSFLVLAALAAAQQKPFQAQSTSSINYSVNKDGAQTVEIVNTAYEVTGQNVPGRKPLERLLLSRQRRHEDEIMKLLANVCALCCWPMVVALMALALPWRACPSCLGRATEKAAGAARRG